MHTPPDRRDNAAEEPQPAETSVEIRIRIPRTWLRELDTIAADRAVSRSDLVRLVVRGWLRERYAGPDP